MLILQFLAVLIALIAAAAVLLWGQHRQRARAAVRALAPEVAAMRWQAAALAAEITRRYRAGTPFDAEFFQVWRLSPPLVFPALGADLGYLSREAVGRIGYFHAQLAAARERLALAEGDEGFRPSPYRMLSLLVRAFNEVTPWVEPHLDISTRNPADLSDANALLGELEALEREPVSMAYHWTDNGEAGGAAR